MQDNGDGIRCEVLLGLGVELKDMKRVLIACEESQAVCIEFRKLGIEAFSCDIQECSGGHPEWHIQDDVFKVIDQGWDAVIAFPPCTHLAVSGAAWFEQKRKDGRQQEGIDFFLKIANAPVKHIAIENPVGIMSKIYKKPTQIIQPYMFGDEVKKTTCLWLKNLPMLYYNKGNTLFWSNEVVEPDIITLKTGARFSRWDYELSLNRKTRAKLRSKTFPGIARAMAVQWGEYLLNLR